MCQKGLTKTLLPHHFHISDNFTLVKRYYVRVNTAKSSIIIQTNHSSPFSTPYLTSCYNCLVFFNPRVAVNLRKQPLISWKSFTIPDCVYSLQRHSIHGMNEEENVIRPHQEMAQLSLDEKKFLLAVERGDVATTRRYGH